MDLVIDASVAVKWLIDEAGTADALRIRRHRLFAPELLMAECANVLWKKVRRNELTDAEALAAAELLEHAEIELEPMRRLTHAATRLAIALDHPAYDCVYLALAQSLSCDLVTADERLHRLTLPTSSTTKVLNLAQAAAV